jgi:uroporphyrinogen decarboxylase
LPDRPAIGYEDPFAWVHRGWRKEHRNVSGKRWEPLSREQVIKAVERNGPCRIPLIHAKWWGEGLREQYGDRLKELDRFPHDFEDLWVDMLNVNKMNLSWKIKAGAGHDSNVVIDDWAKLDEFIARMPDPRNDPQMDKLAEQAPRLRATGKYLLFGWWRLFFERPWGLRGMENLMIDYYEYPDKVHKLHDALYNLYAGYLERAFREIKPDGFWTSDDLGHQTQPMMSPQIFRELIKPYYDRIGAILKPAHVHWWLHSCGNNTLLLPDLIDAGVTVFHPVQKHTMDEKTVVSQFGDKITFLAGIDVQHTLQEKDPAGVREEVRFLIDTFDRPEGGMCIAAGNGIVSGTPFENIVAFLDEALAYGQKHRAMYAKTDR